ncbi:MAG: hypothetical protein KDK51_04875 [Deltaproteobacteria bacterium]|nr:hypothetical protein [Deltaproteobacteria bacterium]
MAFFLCSCASEKELFNSYEIIVPNALKGIYVVTNMDTDQIIEENTFTVTGDTLNLKLEVSIDVENFKVTIKDADILDYYNNELLTFSSKQTLDVLVDGNNEEHEEEIRYAMTPYTTLAACFSDEPGFANELFSEHLGFDFREIIPENSDSNSSLPEKLEYYMWVAGFSYMARLHADLSTSLSSPILNTMTLIDILCVDASDGIFDGLKNNTDLDHGAVPLNNQFLRSELVDALFYYLESGFNTTAYFGDIVPLIAGSVGNNTNPLMFDE